MRTKTIIKASLATAASLTLLVGTLRAADAKDLYEKSCAACHGKDGRGQTMMGRKSNVKDYTDPKVQAALTDEKAIKTITEGIKDDKGKERMKAYGDTLSAEEIKALVAYIRTFKAP